jgi:hypothetical protein
VPDGCYAIADSKASIENLFIAALEHQRRVIKGAREEYGFDAEWNQNSDLTCALQLSVASHPAWFIDLYNAGIHTPPDVAEHCPSMKSFFELPNMIPVGRNVAVDIARLNALGIVVKEWVELRPMALRFDPKMKTGLANLSECFLGITMDKFGQKADWQVSPKIPLQLVRYGVLDAVISRLLLPSIRQKLRKLGKIDDQNVIEAPLGLQAGTIVEYIIYGKARAIAEIVFVGGTGPSRKWGKMTIGARRALICIKEVKCKSTRPPISYEANPNDQSNGRSWKKEDHSLTDIFENLPNPVIAVNTSSLRLPLIGQDMQTGTIGDYYPLILSDIDDGVNDQEETDPFCSNHDGMSNEPNSSFGGIGPLAIEIDDDDDDGSPRSRSKEDIFHQFQDLPLKKDEAARSVISELLIWSTFRMEKTYFDGVKAHLAKEQNVTGEVELMKHFIHNREYWRQHIPMFTPPPDEHADLIRSVYLVVEADPELSKLCTPDLKTYFDEFEKKARHGLFEELEDVVMHEQVGCDKFGLPLFIRKRGTVRTENVHQKMKVAIGPWGIGARAAHYLLLLLCFRYNVSSNIRRRGHHNFGHFELDLIDRIQIRIREIYNVQIYPLHQNLMEFKGTNLISVGIGPLSYDENYVEVGVPDDCLSGNMLFIAEKMGLNLPLMPIGTMKEIQIFTTSMGRLPQPTDTSFKELAKLYKQKANGIDIFPKLPAMVKAYYNRWKKNQAIKRAQEGVGQAVLDLRRTLFRKSASIESVYAADILKDLQNRDTDVNTAPAMPMATLAEEREDAPLHTYVPPIAAPTQRRYVAPHIITSTRRCAFFPFCKSIAMECGGTMKKLCKNYGQFKGISNIDLQAAKINVLNQERKATRRAAKLN